MSDNKRTITGWVMTEVGKPVEKRELLVDPPKAGEVLVEVAGCGVCHTDISFLYQGVPVRHELPLVLGHEISGTVREAGEGVDASLVGKPVLIPAVLPCGECDLCKSDNRTICRNQVMPGNDNHGGFATHVVVPARYVCPVPDAVLAKYELWEIACVADAVTTPFMSVKRSGLAEGDLAIIIGAGGVGIHCVQIAAACGAKVLALDIDDTKLEIAKAGGAGAVINVSDKGFKEIRAGVKDAAKAMGAKPFCWKIFETSGSKPGQETAFGLLGFGGYLGIVGFTLAKLEVRLSNLMAFDATVRGNWGCDPELYPEALDWLAQGKIKLTPYVEKHPLDDINKILEAAHHGQLTKRAVLIP